MYVTDRRMKKLNMLYRGRDAYTDVLAFSAREGVRVKGAAGYLGDIIISADAPARQAARFGSTKRREEILYIIHGILHLLGYDDTAPEARRRMSRRQEYILRKALG